MILALELILLTHLAWPGDLDIIVLAFKTWPSRCRCHSWCNLNVLNGYIESIGRKLVSGRRLYIKVETVTVKKCLHPSPFTIMSWIPLLLLMLNSYECMTWSGILWRFVYRNLVSSKGLLIGQQATLMAEYVYIGEHAIWPPCGHGNDFKWLGQSTLTSTLHIIEPL